jgi:SAM-dependent methyltransferase
MYVTPRPSEADLSEYAETSEAVRFWSTHFYRETAAGRREKMFRPRARLVADLVVEGRASAGRLADVGAGYGLFLQEAAATGVFRELVGIEPDARLAAICRDQGFAVVERWVEATTDGEVAADVATCFEVIEHAFDPLAFLEGCRRALRGGGLLVLTTLTIGGFDLQVLWERSRSITPPQHINFPSLDGARRLVERAGLELVELATPGELDVDIVRNVLIAQPDLELPRVARALALADDAARADLQVFLKRHHMSSHLRVLARRPA